MRVRMSSPGGNATLSKVRKPEKHASVIAIATNTSIRSFPMPESRERPAALVGCTAGSGATLVAALGTDEPPMRALGTRLERVAGEVREVVADAETEVQGWIP